MKSLLDSRSKFWASPSQLLSLPMLGMVKKNALFESRSTHILVDVLV